MIVDDNRRRFSLIVVASLALLLGFSLAGRGAPPDDDGKRGSGRRPPDILLILMDDVGVDQMTAFGWGGVDPASTPNIDTIAEAGVKFTNVWSMPECSPARTTIFTGRWPLRTGVQSALVENMLPQDQLSPYETTLPRVLRNAGYVSAMVGKYHLGSFNNPSGDCAPATCGWDYFNGNVGADPPSIDGGAGLKDPCPRDHRDPCFPCGFDQSPESGACYFIDGTCEPERNGRQCLEAGGILVAGSACESPTPSDVVDFSSSRYNGYYVWPNVTTQGALPPPSGPGECVSDDSANCTPGDDHICTSTVRQYMTVDQTDKSVAWWNAQTQPRMLTVSYNAIHTPYQQPSTELLSKPEVDTLTCKPTDDAASRLLANAMFEAMDVAIGHLLEGLHLATLNAERTQITSLHLGNTLLVLSGDNGTYGQIVKPPFDLGRAKGTVYQTGVWVPLIVAGDLVKHPGRSVDALINEADYFELFAAAAGVDVHDPNVVPSSHMLDSLPMLPYLTNSGQKPIREDSFTQLGIGFFATPVAAPSPPACVPNRSWPCVPGTQCVEGLIGNEARCEDNAGTWYGPPDNCADPTDPCNPSCTAPPPTGTLTNCCQYLSEVDEKGTISPIQQYAVRNQNWKLVRLELEDCEAPIPPSTAPIQRPFPWAEYGTKTVVEFYSLKPTKTNPAGIDRAEDNLLKECQRETPPPPPCCSDPATCLHPEARVAFEKLNKRLEQILASEPACPGDGNLDKVVNQLDLDGVQAFAGPNPSFFDFNRDGQTDDRDQDVVQENFGTNCLPPSR
jgi:arylsulfatase A-like enzyme